MACNAKEIRDVKATWVGNGPHTTPVIADRGDAATIVIVRSQSPLRLGDRFDFEGMTWVISREYSRQRGFVARPQRRR